jgi:glycosyltransferase involved in cell wall biosynthesis
VKLVFVTQVYDERDAVLGFVAGWVRELAARCESVRVVCLEAGELARKPANVEVRVLGRKGRILRWWRWRRFLSEAFADGATHVLAHMVPRYANMARGQARGAGAKLCLWYTHAGVDRRLLDACRACDLVFTASAESLRVEAPNKVVTGHGIDLRHFAPRAAPDSSPARILSVGRLTPSKDPLVVVDALALLARQGRDLHLDLVGAGLVESDRSYREEVERRIAAHGLEERVHLHGAVPWLEVPPWFQRASVVVNASHTGSIDKVVLEAMAMERPVVSCNDAVPPLLAATGARRDLLSFPPGDSAALAAAVARLLDMDDAERARLGRELRGIVAKDHEVGALMERLVRSMEAIP